MADMTNVDADKLKHTAQKISGLAGDLNGIVGKITDAMNNLAKGWQSEAATKFMQAWQLDREALSEMVDQYREVAEMMFELAQDFENSEDETGNLISKLRVR